MDRGPPVGVTRLPYFHVVFTVPEQVAAIAYQNRKLVYGILFQIAAETPRTIAADPEHLGAEVGFFTVLHSWGQNSAFHPHLHRVVAGGLSPDGERWISSKPDFFLPVRVLRISSNIIRQRQAEVFGSPRATLRGQRIHPADRKGQER